jgi:adenine-specific DNA-methyltransferase
MLRYLLDCGDPGSQSLLNIDAFADPTAYHLSVKKPGSDTHEHALSDLIETFNYLIGLRVTHYAAPQSFQPASSANPTRNYPKTSIPSSSSMARSSRMPTARGGSARWRAGCRETHHLRTTKPEKSPQNMERILIVWRKLTGDLEQDNLMLDVWFRKHAISTQDYEYDTIYVNGSNNLPNLKQDNEHWKVRLIEEEFMKRMWDTSES